MMKRPTLHLLAVALFVAPMLGSHTETQTLGSVISWPFALRAGWAESWEMNAPSKTKKITICVAQKSAPVEVSIRKQQFNVFPGTCKTRRTNKALGIKKPKRTSFKLRLPSESTRASGWVHFKN